MIFIIIVDFDSPVRRGRIIHSRNCTAITTVKDIVIIAKNHKIHTKFCKEKNGRNNVFKRGFQTCNIIVRLCSKWHMDETNMGTGTSVFSYRLSFHHEVQLLIS